MPEKKKFKWDFDGAKVRIYDINGDFINSMRINEVAKMMCEFRIKKGEEYDLEEL